jgi:hypothetical protein
MLEELTNRVDPLYGQIAVEGGLLSPADFMDIDVLRGDLYISTRLADNAIDQVNSLREDFGPSVVAE